jgi:hypothetical protein
MGSRDIACLIVRAMMKHLPNVYSGQYPVRPVDCGEHKAVSYWTLMSTGNVPDALFLQSSTNLSIPSFQLTLPCEWGRWEEALLLGKSALGGYPRQVHQSSKEQGSPARFE